MLFYVVFAGLSRTEGTADGRLLEHVCGVSGTHFQFFVLKFPLCFWGFINKCVKLTAEELGERFGVEG